VTDISRRKDYIKSQARLISQRCVHRHVQHDDEQVSDATRDEYDKAWTEWSAWCARHDIGRYHPTRTQKRRWAEHLLEQRMPLSAIETHLTGVAWCHAKAGQQSPVALHGAGQSIAASAWRRSDAARTAAPISLAAIQQIVGEIPYVLGKPDSDPQVIRDRCLLTLGWTTARHDFELVALDTDDLAFTEEKNLKGLLVHVKPPGAEGLIAGPIVLLPSWGHPTFCPVRTARRQVEQRRHGPLFVSTHDTGNDTGARLDRTVVGDLVKHYAERVLGDDADHYSAHSLRAGFVQHARERGASERAIANATADSDTGHLHPRDAASNDLFYNPVLERIGW